MLNNIECLLNGCGMCWMCENVGVGHIRVRRLIRGGEVWSDCPFPRGGRLRLERQSSYTSPPLIGRLALMCATPTLSHIQHIQHPSNRHPTSFNIPSQHRQIYNVSWGSLKNPMRWEPLSLLWNKRQSFSIKKQEKQANTVHSITKMNPARPQLGGFSFSRVFLSHTRHMILYKA